MRSLAQAAQIQCARMWRASVTKKTNAESPTYKDISDSTQEKVLKKQKRIGQLARLSGCIGHSTPRGGQEQTQVTGKRGGRKPNSIITF